MDARECETLEDYANSIKDAFGFDSVMIVATGSKKEKEPGQELTACVVNAGNWYASYGFLHEYMRAQDEKIRQQQRANHYGGQNDSDQIP